MDTRKPPRKKPGNAFAFLEARRLEGLSIVGRRSLLKASVGGMAGLSLPGLLRRRAGAAAGDEERGRARRAPAANGRSVILLWMAGGPSHIDTLDVKPEAPREVRGPFAAVPTRIPGVLVCEHLPRIAAIADRLTIIRSVDARRSNHQPNQVFQTGNLDAEPRVNPAGASYPAIASLAARLRGTNDPRLPPYVALNIKDRTHIAWGGYAGREHDPFIGDDVERLLDPPAALPSERLRGRRSLCDALDRLRRDLDLSGSMAAIDRFGAQAIDMVTGEHARAAFDIAREPERVRDLYGGEEWCQQALRARRLVEAGAAFVTVVLSNHSASGTWDTHGDNIPPYGGIWNGLRPLLPVFDRLFSTLVSDLEQRGLLSQVLVLAMGEFGRTPMIGTQGSTDGRDHWPYVMSMLLAGGPFRHGQVIGATERDGGAIKERPVTPGDIAATIYHHLDVPLDAAYEDFQGRPRRIVEHGEPLAELL
jgi:hypothetical protein